MRVLAIAGLTSLFLFACGHQSGAARAQEAATELNVNTRFGRMELAAEFVAPDAREAFMARRKAWGGNVRVADYELAGFAMKGDSDAETLVRVAWYRANEGDLRTTTLKQKWHDYKGDWRLVDETRAEGDVGLIGEPMAAPAPAAKTPARAAQFPTIRLGQSSPEPMPEEVTPPAAAPAVPAAAP